MKLITGHAGEAHITAADDGAVNSAILGTEKYVLNTGKKFAIEKLDNNAVRIWDGYAINQGRKMGIPFDEYEELIMENGEQNRKRADLIVIRYSKNVDSGIETATLTVIKGTSGSEYVDPEIITGNIIAGEIEDDMILYRVRINGIEIEEIDTMFEIMDEVQTKSGDSANETITFESFGNSDLNDAPVDWWKPVGKLESGEKHKTLFEKISKMFFNINNMKKIIIDMKTETQIDTKQKYISDFNYADKKYQKTETMGFNAKSLITNNNSLIGKIIDSLTGLSSDIDDIISSDGNVAINDQTPTYTTASTLAEPESGEKLSVAFGKIKKAIKDFIAHKKIYGDTFVSMERKEGTIVSSGSFAFGYNTTASGSYSHAFGYNTTASGRYSHAEGYHTIASEDSSHAEGDYTTASSYCSHAEGYCTTTANYASHASGKYSKAMTSGASGITQVGDVFVIGNGTGLSKLSNALRITYSGDIYGTKAFQSSGADYAEFIKPWFDGNEENEDRIGYFVTVKDGLLYKANEGDVISGITSGNPSVVGNADEDYYWRYERDEFNRIVWEDVPEIIEKRDKDGNIIIDEETGQPVWEETGKIIKNGRMKLSADYDPSMQNTYIERKYRKEWDYVGMVGVLPVRDDGTCEAGKLCKCGQDGIATLATERGFDTYMVIERINDHVVSVILK